MEHVTYFAMLFVTSLASLLSAASTLSAQTKHTGTFTPSASSPVLSAVWALLPEFAITAACVGGMVMMAVKGGWWSKAKPKLSALFTKKRRHQGYNDWPDRKKTKTKSKPKRPAPAPNPDRPLPPPRKKPAPAPKPKDPALPPPDRKPLPAPPGRAPALPENAMGVQFDGSPSLDAIEDWSKKYLDGPIDARSAVPWDEYEYPEIPAPPPAAIKAYDRDKRFMDWLKEWLENDDEDADEMRTLDERLPESRNDADVQASTRALLGVTPLDYLDEYLEMCGIRHFTAKELTRHNWHKSKIKKGRTWIRSKASFKPVIERACAWSSYFSVFDPDSKVHFVLPRRVVPDPRLWPNIIPILRVIDRFRAWKKARVTGISGYRLPWYNHSIQGSSNSFHMTFSAFDFTYSDRTKNGDIDARIFYRFFLALYRVTGSGMGAYASFIHADLDQSRHKLKGKAVRWIHRARRIYSDVFNRGESYSMVGKK